MTATHPRSLVARAARVILAGTARTVTPAALRDAGVAHLDRCRRTLDRMADRGLVCVARADTYRLNRTAIAAVLAEAEEYDRLNAAIVDVLRAATRPVGSAEVIAALGDALPVGHALRSGSRMAGRLGTLARGLDHDVWRHGHGRYAIARPPPSAAPVAPRLASNGWPGDGRTDAEGYPVSRRVCS